MIARPSALNSARQMHDHTCSMSNCATVPRWSENITATVEMYLY